MKLPILIVYMYSFQMGVSSLLTIGGDECVASGSTVSIVCSSSVSGSPTWRWYKGVGTSSGDLLITKDSSGNLTPNTGRYSIVDDGTLTISQSTKSDSGQYWCSATGPGFLDPAKSFTLSVADVPKSATVEINTEVVEALVTVNMTCTTSELDISDYTWEKNGLTVDENTGDISLFDSGRILNIHSATQKDEGKYACTVINCAGNLQSGEVDLLIPKECKNADMRSSSEYSLNFKHSGLSCEILADCLPNATVRWDKNSAEVPNEDGPILKTKMSNSYVTINGTVCNELGCSSKEITINVMALTLTVFVIIIIVVCIVVIGLLILIVYLVYRKTNRVLEETAENGKNTRPGEDECEDIGLTGKTP